MKMKVTDAILELQMTTAHFLKVLAVSVLLGVAAILMTFLTFPEKLYDVSILFFMAWIFVGGVNAGLLVATKVIEKKVK